MSHRVPLLIPLATLLALAATSSTGCAPQGTLQCNDGWCPAPGRAEPDGGSDPGDLGPDPVDQGPERADLGTPTDLAPQPDGGAEPCPVGSWPRAERAGHDPSGGRGGASGEYELTLSAAGDSVSVLVYAPDCPGGGPLLGLAVALHDVDGDRDYLLHKWRRAATQRGYVVALPRAARGYVGERNWLENGERNQEAVRATVTALLAAYPIDRRDVLLTGLGVGATFANDHAAAEADGTFAGLLLVNGTLWDPALETRQIKSLLVLGQQDSPSLSTRPSSAWFRYLYLPALGPYYPGPVYPGLEGDPTVPEIDPTAAVDWFWP